MLPSLSVVVGETDAIAREKAAFLDDLIDPELVTGVEFGIAGVDPAIFNRRKLPRPPPATRASRDRWTG